MIENGNDTNDETMWRPMKDAPRGTLIVARQGAWVATVILNPIPRDEQTIYSCGDKVMHYNGEVLVDRFRGCWDGWMPLPEDKDD